MLQKQRIYNIWRKSWPNENTKKETRSRLQKTKNTECIMFVRNLSNSTTYNKWVSFVLEKGWSAYRSKTSFQVIS